LTVNHPVNLLSLADCHPDLRRVYAPVSGLITLMRFEKMEQNF